MSEKTVVQTMSLPFGQRWAWFADANVVGLADWLTDAERELALDDCQASWRRSALHVVTPDEQPRSGAA